MAEPTGGGSHPGGEMRTKLMRFLRHGGWLVVLPLVVVAAALDSAADSRRAAARLASSGIDARATITGKFERRRMVPRVRSSLLEPEHVVRFSYSSGSVLRGDFHVGTGEARVTRDFFDRIEPGGTAPLRYLPEDDTVFELEPGSHAREAGNALAIAGLIAVLSLPPFVLVARRAARATQRRETPGSSA